MQLYTQNKIEERWGKPLFSVVHSVSQRGVWVSILSVIYM